MKLLIAECLPRALKRLFGEHVCQTVQEMKWRGKKNGELLSLAERDFDVLVTIDQGMQYEQDLANRKIAVLVLRAPRIRSRIWSPFSPLRWPRSGAPGRGAWFGPEGK
jgi:predicted nuclease of predicted toxin-antitoxin system